MSQEYTENKHITLNRLTAGKCLLEAVLIILLLFAIWLMVVLLSFSPSDPNWSQTAWHEPIDNIGGRPGAWFADTLLFIFGVIAYVVPLLIVGGCWFTWRYPKKEFRHYIDYFAVALRLIGSLALIITSCGLTAMNIDDIWYFASGGVIGSLVDTALAPWLKISESTLALLCVWAAGFTLFTGWSWVTIAEKIGAGLFWLLTFVGHRNDPGKNWQQAPSLQHSDINSSSAPRENPVSAPRGQKLSEKFASAANNVSDKALFSGHHLELSTQTEPDEPDVLFSGHNITDIPLDDEPLPRIIPEFDSPHETANSVLSKPSPLVDASESQDLPSAQVSVNNLNSSEGIPEADTGNHLPDVVPYKTVGSMDLSLSDKNSPAHSDNLLNTVPVITPLQADTPLDEESRQQQALTREFAEQQHQRYHANDAMAEYPAQPLSDEAPQMTSHIKTNQPVPDSLIHPLLMRNSDERSLPKPTTPLPSLDLLTPPPNECEPLDHFALEQMARLVEARLKDFRIQADVVNYLPGPVITRFELNLAPGVKAARISNLARDLARSLSAVAVRVVEVIPGKPYVGLELPNKKRQTVYLREVLDCPAFRDSSSPLTVVLGKDISGEPVVADLAKTPHLLVAGTTGSGKSVGVNAMILSMLYKASPEDVKFIMIDPKMLELSVYAGIPHLLTDVVTDMKDAANALRWCVGEMERRYKLMSALGVRNMAGYNDKIRQADVMGRPIPDPYWKPGDSMATSHPMLEKLPYIVVIVDEFADLMMTVGKKVEELIARLAQKARAAGIHLVLATQRPSVDVITGLIKANIPSRIAFTVSSKIDSRTILDQSGAESLLGMGDMLYCGPASNMPVRIHGAFVRDQEVHAAVQDWQARGRPHYIEGITSETNNEGSAGGGENDDTLDPLFDQAVAFIVEKRKASISGVQRQFRIGYNRAARIIEQMEAQGIVSEAGHNGNREVLAPPPFD